MSEAEAFVAEEVAALDALGESFRAWLENEYGPRSEAVRVAGVNTSTAIGPQAAAAANCPLAVRQARRRNAHVLGLRRVLDLAREGRRVLEVVNIDAVERQE
jgi:hypothetical protein